MSEKDSINTNIRRNSYYLCLFMSFTILIFAPLNLYMTNQTEFWFDIYQILPLLLLCFSAFCFGGIVMIWGLSFICPNLLKYGNIIVFTLTVCAYIQGNYFIYDYMVLDGMPIEWSKHVQDGIWSAVFWILMFVVMLAIGSRKKSQQKFQSISKVVAICILLVEMVALVITAMTMDGLKKKDGGTLTRKNEFVYSPNQNLTIFILDTFDAREFTKILNENQELKEIFKDFTYYPDNVTRFDFTDYSIPQIVTGQDYNGENYQDYMQDSFTNSPLFKQLKKNGWSTNVYLDVKIPHGASKDLFDNYQNTKLGISSKRRMIGYIYKLVGFQYLPYQLKQTCWYYPDEINDLRYVKSVDGRTEFDDNEGEPYYWSNNNFNEEMNEVTGDAATDMCHIYHLRGIHTPRYYDRDFNCVGVEVGLDESGICVAKMLNRYLNLLRENNFYDNNAILILADHGTLEMENGVYRHNPLLMVKGMKENHDMAISDMTVSYVNLQDMYTKLLDGKTGENVMTKIEGVRSFYAMGNNPTPVKGKIKKQFTECLVNGNAANIENIVPTENVIYEK